MRALHQVAAMKAQVTRPHHVSQQPKVTNHFPQPQLRNPCRGGGIQSSRRQCKCCMQANRPSPFRERYVDRICKQRICGRCWSASRQGRQSLMRIGICKQCMETANRVSFMRPLMLLFSSLSTLFLDVSQFSFLACA